MIDKKNIKWLVAGILILVVFGTQNTLPKEAVADVNGVACNADEDCPCWGKIETQSIDAFGIGVSQCIDCSQAGNQNLTGCNIGGYTSTLRCDTTYCFDIQPLGEYVRDKPWAWLKNNPLMTAAIIGLGVLLIMWPKQ